MDGGVAGREVAGRRVRGVGWGAAAVGSSIFPWWVRGRGGGI